MTCAATVRPLAIDLITSYNIDLGIEDRLRVALPAVIGTETYGSVDTQQWIGTDVPFDRGRLAKITDSAVL